jgi:drug/metabolite transporter (DMT)-like permease
MRTRTAFNRLAAGLAFVIGAMAVFAGGQVLLGQLPDYYVIDWLPIYNLTLGVVSALFASVVIWRNSRLALPTATTIFGLHAIVMLVLLTAYRQVVAVDSLRAMTIRLVAWTVILILLLAARRQRP